MKRVLILNGDSYVGRHVAQAFHQSHEYQIDVTLSHRDDDMVQRQSQRQPGAKTADLTTKEMCAAAAGGAVEAPRKDMAPLVDCVPSALRPYVDHIVPRHNDDPTAFCQRLLENDVIVAVLEDDSYEAECAIRVLAGSHYEVEKTFVLVSSAITWANTRMVDVARVRAERRKARDDEIAAFREEMEGEVDEIGAQVALPDHLAQPLDEEMELEIAEASVAPRTYTEDEYATRVPHPRYQHWRLLEHLVKHANSQTLHTYVLFAGLPYGHGEGPLHSLVRAAWHQQSLTCYGRGDNVIPMIHVEDLAKIAYKLGSAYDVYDERYLIAVDRGQVTQRALLHILTSSLGGAVEEAPFSTTSPPALDMVHLRTATLPRPPTIEELRARFGNAPGDGLRMAFFLSDMRLEPGAALSYHEEDDWVALDGFAENIHKVVDQFRVTHKVTPTRLLLAGPPLSGKEGVAHSLAAHYKAPLVTAKAAAAAYEAYADALHERLANLLATRLQRRRDRMHARKAAEILTERARVREEARAARRARRGQGGEGDGKSDDANDDEGDEERDKDSADDDEEEESEEDEEGEEGFAKAERTGVLPLVLPDDRHTDVHAIVRRHRYLLGLLNESGSEGIDESVLDYVLDENNCALYRSEEGADELADGEDALDDEENEEEEADNDILDDVEVIPEEERDPDLPAEEQGPSRAQVRARLAIRRQDAEERAVIKSLRQAYAVALKVLSMRTVNGELPHPRPVRDEVEDEDGAEESNDRERQRGTPGRFADDDDDDAEDEDSGEDADRHDDAENGGSADVDDKDENEDDEKEDEADETAADAKTHKYHHHHLPAGGRYLDEALACMLRWRLRQVDCQNRGFVLLDFPRSVRHAYCLFYSSQAAAVRAGDGEEAAREAAAMMARRMRPLTSEEDVIAPEDSDYPFLENFVAMETDARRAREKEIAAALLPDEQPQSASLATAAAAAAVRAREARQLLDVLQKAGFASAAEGLLAPVDEALFPDQLVLLRDEMEVLQLRAQATSAMIKEAFQLHLAYGISKSAARADGEEDASMVAAAGSGTRVVKQLRRQQQQPLQAQLTGVDVGEWSLSVDTITYANTLGGPTEAAADEVVASHRAWRLVEKLAAPFHRGLRDFQAQYNESGSTSDSVLTWLQSVSTTERLGATPAPVLAVRDNQAGSADGGGGDADEDGAAAERLDAPSTSRTLHVVHVQSPTRTTMEVCQELFTHFYFTDAIVPQEARALLDTLHKGDRSAQKALPWLAALASAKRNQLGSGLDKSILTASVRGETSKGTTMSSAASAMVRPYAYREATERVQLLISQLSSGADPRAFLAELVMEQHRQQRAAAATAATATTSNNSTARKKRQSRATLTEPTAAPLSTTLSGATAAVTSALYPPLVLFTEQLCASVLRDVRALHFGPPTRRADSESTWTTDTAPVATRDVAERTHLSATDPNSSMMSADDEERQEIEWLAKLHAREHEEMEATRQSLMDVVKSERQVLRALQIRESCRDGRELSSLPMETYLMRYVLPSLTPALTEVTKLRPECPVTALADVLYNYKRRTEI